MDLTAVAIIAASAAIPVVKDAAEQVVVESYEKLKGLIREKFGENSDLVQAVDQLEAKPESLGRKETLFEEVAAVNADQDFEIFQATQEVLGKLKTLRHGEQYIEFITRDNIFQSEILQAQDVEIRSGQARLITSGLATAFKNNPIEIVYGPPGERLRLIFEFKDQEGETQQVQGDVVTPTTLRFTLINFREPIGSGSINPIPIGLLNEHKLYIHFRVYSIPSSDKTIHFSIYSEEEVEG